MTTSSSKSRQARPLTAREMQLMDGSPPSQDRTVTINNFLSAPHNRWALQHLREIVPTRSVSPGVPPSILAQRPLDLSGVEVEFPDGRMAAVGPWLESSYTDGFIVLHQGDVVYERYFNDHAPLIQHLMFSVTKSFTGIIALILIERGLIDEAKMVGDYIPELIDTAFADATIRCMLDMANSIKYIEDYTDPDAHISAFADSFMPGGEGLYSNLKSLTEKDPRFSHGDAFHYVTPDPEVLAWIIRRVTGKTLASSLHEMIWAPMGAEHEGYYWLDTNGVEMAGGGLAIALRDAARFGQMILQDGYYNERQVVSPKVATRIKSKRNADIFTRYYGDNLAGMELYDSYHDQWWGYADMDAITGIGIHGQNIYINSDSGVVIAKQSSEPHADGEHETKTALVMHAISNWLSPP